MKSGGGQTRKQNPFPFPTTSLSHLIFLFLCFCSLYATSTARPVSHNKAARKEFHASLNLHQAHSLASEHSVGVEELEGRVDIQEALAAFEEWNTNIWGDMNTAELGEILLENSNGSFALHFDHFPNATAPIELRSGDKIRARGYLIHPVSVGTYSQHLHMSVLWVEVLPSMRPESLIGSGTYSESGSDTFKILYILQDFSDATNDCGSRADIESLAFSGSRSVRGAYLDISNGKRVIEDSGGNYQYHIAGPYLASSFSKSDSCANYLTWRAFAQAAAEADGYDLTQYATMVVIHPRTTSCSWAGKATLSNCNPRSYDPPHCKASIRYCQQFVLSHELGHNMNIHHSATDTPNSDVTVSSNTYRDYSCLMGNQNSWNRLNAPHMIQKGWLPTNKVQKLTSPGLFTLSSLDIPSSTASNIQVLLFEDVTSPFRKEYYFSYRTRDGYAYALSSSYTDGLNIHYFRSSACPLCISVSLSRSLSPSVSSLSTLSFSLFLSLFLSLFPSFPLSLFPSFPLSLSLFFRTYYPNTRRHTPPLTFTPSHRFCLHTLYSKAERRQLVDDPERRLVRHTSLHLG